MDFDLSKAEAHATSMKMKGWRSRKTETKLKRSVLSGARCDKTNMRIR
jgi:hypothetical protein